MLHADRANPEDSGFVFTTDPGSATTLPQITGHLHFMPGAESENEEARGQPFLWQPALKPFLLCRQAETGTTWRKVRMGRCILRLTLWTFPYFP